MRALQGVEALGVPVVFVTGRPPRWMSEIAERTGHTGLAICANGALVYDLHSEKVVDHFPLSVEVGLDVARRLRAALPDVRFAVETLDGFAHEPSYQPRWDVGQASVRAPASTTSTGAQRSSSCWPGTRSWTPTRCSRPPARWSVTSPS